MVQSLEQFFFKIFSVQRLLKYAICTLYLDSAQLLYADYNIVWMIYLMCDYDGCESKSSLDTR